MDSGYRRACVALVVTVVLAVCGVATAADEATLTWAAGDRLTGSLVGADDTSLTWKSPLFADPLQLQLSVLSEVRYPQPGSPPAAAAGPLRVLMQNGDVLYGSLVSVTDQTFQLKSLRHGIIPLKREQIRSLRRIDSPGLVFLGPQGLGGWRHPLFAQWAEPPGWVESAEGHLTTQKPEAVMFRPTEFPSKCEIEIVLSATERPSFVLALGSRADTSLRLETWDNALVAMSQDDFVSVATVPDSQRKLHLFLFVDFETRRMVVFSETGKQLAEIAASEGDSGVPGILLRNGEKNLTLEYLSVARWDGSRFQGVQASRSRVHTADGRVYYGQIVRVSEDQQSIVVSDGTITSEVRIDDVRGLIVAEGDATPAVPAGGLTQVLFHDGEMISGVLRACHDGQLALQTVHSDEPVVSRLDNVQNIVLPGTAAPPEDTDRLYFPGGSLQGTLMVDDESAAPVRWMPLGGVNASAVTASGTARFVRGQAATEVAVDSDQFPDIAWLTNNDVIPCRLQGCTDAALQLTSPFFQVHEIPVADVRAVELRQPRLKGKTGFGDRGWRRIVGSPQHEPDRLVFKASEAMGHTSILTGDVLQFKLAWGERVAATLTFHLYTRLPSSVPTGIPVSFVCRRETLCVEDGTLAEAGAFAPRGIPLNPAAELSVPQRVANVTIFRQGDRIRVSVNGQLANTFAAPKNAADTRGLLLRANIINISRELNRERGGSDGPSAPVEADKTIEVSEFEIRDLVGGSIRQFIDAESREASLLVPRFRRETPPTHVLLAPNGDLLRGRLLELRDDTMVFESRLEKIQLPRSRVAAIIWLKPPGENSASEDRAGQVTASDPAASPDSPPTTAPLATVPPPTVPSTAMSDVVAAASSSTAEPRPIQVVMEQGVFLTMIPDRVQQGHLLGHSPRLGECSIPVAGIRELSVGPQDAGTHAAAYAAWIPRHAPEPKWDIPEESDDSPARQMIGEIAPGIQLPMLDGSLFRLPDHQDKIVVLDFWATWCGPCARALPGYLETISELDSKRVIFIAVNLEETPQTVRAFLKQQGLSPRVAMDRTGIVGAEFNVSGIPHTVVIGPGNVIEQVSIGYRSGAAAELKETIEKILAGTWQRPVPAETAEPRAKD